MIPNLIHLQAPKVPIMDYALELFNINLYELYVCHVATGVHWDCWGLGVIAVQPSNLTMLAFGLGVLPNSSPKIKLRSYS